MHLRIWIFVVQSIIVIPPFILYLLEMKILLTTKGNEFSSPFYSLFIACGFTDIISVLLSHFFHALPMAANLGDGYVSSLPIWSFTAANGLLFYLPIVEDFLNIAIALNRLSAMTMPLKYELIWSSRRTLFVILLCFFFGFIPNYIVFVSPATYIKLPVGVGDLPVNLLYPLTQFTFPRISRTLLIGITAFSCNALSAVINLIAVARLVLSKANNVVEVKMLILGISLFITNIPSFSYQLYFFLYPSSSTAGYVVQFLPWIFIFKCLLHPILLLFTNGSMKKRILGGPSKTKTWSDTTVTIAHRS